MMIPLLSSGDTIAITAPAKAIDEALVMNAKKVLEEKGFRVIISPHCTGRYNYFSGTIEERLSDFQALIDSPEVNGILCARGGYGSVQIVDRLNWDEFRKSPKWIIGFSDVTVFHQRVNKLGYPSIHGTMPLNFEDNSSLAIESLFSSITQNAYSIECEGSFHNVQGEASGEIVGGNLSIVYSMMGTDDELNYQDKILFLEEVGEHLYAIDRMFHAFAKAGYFKRIRGLVIGGMTSIKDTEQPFGKTLEEIVLDHCGSLNIPIAFNFPAGHIDDNRALRLGSQTTLIVGKETRLEFQ